MLLAMTESTENLLYIIGGFVAGVIITFITTCINDKLKNKYQKKRFMYEDMLSLLNDILALKEKKCVMELSSTKDSAIANLNKLLAGHLAIKNYYNHYLVYYPKNNVYNKYSEKFSETRHELILKVKDLKTPKQIKGFIDNDIMNLSGLFSKSCNALVKELRISLKEYYKV